MIKQANFQLIHLSQHELFVRIQHGHRVINENGRTLNTETAAGLRFRGLVVAVELDQSHAINRIYRILPRN